MAPHRIIKRIVSCLLVIARALPSSHLLPMLSAIHLNNQSH